MNILLYGTTDTGYMVASLFYQKHNIIVIDDVEHLDERFQNLDIIFISGSGSDVLALEQASIKTADMFIACSASDEVNIIACWTAKKISEVETICFIRRMDLYRNISTVYLQSNQDKYIIDTIIWPEQLLTQDIFRIISVPDAIDVEYFIRGKAKLLEYRIKEDSIIRDCKIMDCNFPEDVLIVGMTRQNNLFIPSGSTDILLDDKIIFMGSGPSLDILAARFFQSTNRIKTASIIGGGSVGFMLCQKLEQAGIRVKLIEKERDRCIYLADNLKKSLILHGDGTDLELLEGESVGDADVTVCITNNDEKNLLCSLMVKQLGCERIITRVSNARNSMLFERVGIDVVVSPRDSAIKELLNRLQKDTVNILALVEGGQGEVLQLKLQGNFPETPIHALQLPAKAIIGVVKRGKKVIFPNGSTVLRPKDLLIIFTMAKDAEAIKEALPQ